MLGYEGQSANQGFLGSRLPLNSTGYRAVRMETRRAGVVVLTQKGATKSTRGFGGPVAGSWMRQWTERCPFFLG